MVPVTAMVPVLLLLPLSMATLATTPAMLVTALDTVVFTSVRLMPRLTMATMATLA